MRSSFLLYALPTFALASAQSLSQETPSQLAAQFPSCVIPCDTSAIASVGCAETDYACHCTHINQLQTLVVPCLLNSSNCSAADLQTFGTLVQHLCLNLNVTANVTSSSTSSPTSSSTIVPFLGAASNLRLESAVFAFAGLALMSVL